MAEGLEAILSRTRLSPSDAGCLGGIAVRLTMNPTMPIKLTCCGHHSAPSREWPSNNLRLFGGGRQRRPYCLAIGQRLRTFGKSFAKSEHNQASPGGGGPLAVGALIAIHSIMSQALRMPAKSKIERAAAMTLALLAERINKKTPEADRTK